MNQKITATLIGVACAILWFMPWVYVSFFGDGRYLFQAGHHIGGIAYLMLLAGLAYAVLSWLDLHVPRIMAAAVSLGIGLLFFVQFGFSSAWGLYGILALSIAALAMAIFDHLDSRARRPASP